MTAEVVGVGMFVGYSGIFLRSICLPCRYEEESRKLVARLAELAAKASQLRAVRQLPSCYCLLVPYRIVLLHDMPVSCCLQLLHSVTAEPCHVIRTCNCLLCLLRPPYLLCPLC